MVVFVELGDLVSNWGLVRRFGDIFQLAISDKLLPSNWRWSL